MPIQILPARLANQIAAGEVVERPASVVKELVENSLDAGATAIEIDIRQGGHKSIVIRDNGNGIEKQQLALALSRHATSKIATLDDLEQITSMGFRGEALASISSVSRLTLTSKPEDQSEAWKAHAEGNDMAVTITPAAHPKGTSIEVNDLFFNTPARRKFLRSEKTEFMHIEEIVKRIVLSRFDVAFTLKHNGKVLRKYALADSPELQRKRIAKSCHSAFLNDALTLSIAFQDLTISGYLLPLADNTAVKDTQYVYVNGRVMRDRVINHAIRQAFEMAQTHHQGVAYILYLVLPPEQIDINVHPAKHEVRFHQGRMVHDFIQRAIRDTLLDMPSGVRNVEGVMEEALPTHDYIRPLTSSSEHSNGHSSGSAAGQPTYRKPSIPAGASASYQTLLKPSDNSTSHHADSQWMYVSSDTLLVQYREQFFAVPTVQLLLQKIVRTMTTETTMQPLLMPVAVSLSPADYTDIDKLITAMSDCGLTLVRVNDRLVLRQVAHVFRALNWAQLLPDLVSCWQAGSREPLLILHQTIAQCDHQFSLVDAQELWPEFLQLEDSKQLDWLSQHAEALALSDWIKSL